MTSRSKMMTQRRWWTIMTLVAFMSSSATGCPAGCQCMAHSVWCVEQGMTSLPVGMADSTRHLYLFHNNITSLDDEILSKLQDLQTLELTNNQLTNSAISDKTFRQLPRLQTLTLNENKLTSIRNDMFAGMRNLMRLYIEDNLIARVDSEAFGNLTGLLEVKLSGNRLSTFPRLTGTANLRRLYLGRNRISSLPNTFQLVDLHDLQLGDNQLRRLPSSTFTQTNLLKLDLSNNRLNQVPPIIKNMTSLQALNLSGNPIAKMPTDLLEKIPSIKVIDLSKMRLKSLSEGFIPPRVWPNLLSLAFNPWNCQCDLSWLLRMMTSSEDVFRNSRNVVCQQPRDLQNTPIIDLTIPHLRCDTRWKTPRLPRPKLPTVNGCDALACANGAKCVRNATNYRPYCKCKTGWKGVLCDKPTAPPTTATTIATTTTTTPSFNHPEPVLLIDHSSVTSHSVTIVLPSTGNELKLSVTEMRDDVIDGDVMSTNEYVILPTALPYTVSGLQAGKTYNICVCSTTGSDVLCASVSTLEIRGLPVELDVEPEALVTARTTDDVAPQVHAANRPPGSAVGVRVVGGPDFPLLYPLVGATLGAFVILTVSVLFYMCHRNKHRVKKAAASVKYTSAEYDAGELALEADTCPLDGAARRSRDDAHLQFLSRDEGGQRLAHNNRHEVYQMAPPRGQYLTTHQPQPVNVYGQRVATPPQREATPPYRMTTPNESLSLTRSSVSGGSDVTKLAGSDVGPTACSDDDVFHHHVSAGSCVVTNHPNNHPHHYTPYHNNLVRENRHNSGGVDGGLVDHRMVVDPNHRMVVRPEQLTSTSVNQMYQTPIVVATTSYAPYLQMSDQHQPNTRHHSHNTVMYTGGWTS